jgi:aminopeptidase-like protein
MNKGLKFIKQIKEKDLERLFDRLFKIPRSITGFGFLKSLNILGEIIDLNIVKIKSNSKVLDWTVPDEWNINDAYVIDPSGKKILEFKKNNLHLVNYSIPLNKTVSLKTLKKHLFTLKNQKNAIPYVTSYYNRTWGFCIEYNKYKKLKKGNYKVVINSSFNAKGNLIYNDTILKGKSKKQIILSTYLCHPQMANNELSGPLLLTYLYRLLKLTGPHKYSYRFVICPENIGSAAFLHKNKKTIKSDVVAGYVINCVANGNKFTLKKSRQSNSLSDRAALNVLLNSNFKNVEIIDFFPDGSDERQYCSPGFNLPVSLIMRNMYHNYTGATKIKDDFPEYHTSLDNKKKFSFKTLLESLRVYFEVLMTIENNFIPKAKVIYGTPQLSKSKYPLYPKLMNFRSDPKTRATRLVLEILNLSEGKIDLLEICNTKKFKLIDYLDIYSNLLKSGYIKKIKQ